MSKTNAPLTDTRCSKAVFDPNDDNRLMDSGGLYLELMPNGTKRWRLRFRQANGKTATNTLGNFPALSVAEARQLRDSRLQFSLLDDLFADLPEPSVATPASVPARKSTKTATTTVKAPTKKSSSASKATKTSSTKTTQNDNTMATKSTKTVAKKTATSPTKSPTKASAKKASVAPTKKATTKVTTKAAKKVSVASSTKTVKTTATKSTSAPKARKQVATKTPAVSRTASSSKSAIVQEALSSGKVHRTVKTTKRTTKVPTSPTKDNIVADANSVTASLSSARSLNTPTSTSDTGNAWGWGGLTLNPNQGLTNKFATIGERPDNNAVEPTKAITPETKQTSTTATSPASDVSNTTKPSTIESQTKQTTTTPVTPPAPQGSTPTSTPTRQSEGASLADLADNKVEAAAKSALASLNQKNTESSDSPHTSTRIERKPIPTAVARDTATTAAAPKLGILKIAVSILVTVGITWGIQAIRISDVESVLAATKKQVSQLNLDNTKTKAELKQATEALSTVQIEAEAQQQRSTRALEEALNAVKKLKHDLLLAQEDLSVEKGKRQEAEAQVAQHQAFRSALSDLRRNYMDNRN